MKNKELMKFGVGVLTVIVGMAAYKIADSYLNKSKVTAPATA